MKKRVLIVEDDKFFRFAVRKFINWEKYNLEIAGDAVHGAAALDFIKKQQVEIVLTDMSMPVMDGIELTGILKKEYPDIMVIALSAYDDFEYVKKSLCLGARDYILKQDIEKGDKGEKIEIAWKNHMKDRMKDGKLSDDIQHFLKNQEKDSNRAGQYLRFALSNPYGWYLCLVKNLDKEWHSPECTQWKWLEDSLLELHENHMHMIFFAAKATPSTAQQDADRNKMLNQIAELLKQEDYIAACSSRTTDMAGVQERYARTKELLETGRLLRNKRMIVREDIAVRNEIGDYVIPKQEFTGIYTYEQANQALQSLTEKIRDCQPDEEHIQMNYLQLINEIAEHLEYTISKLQFSKMKEALSREFLLDQKHRVAENYISQIFDSNKGKRWHRGVLQGIEFMNENYGQDISLQEISEYVSMSESYFSSLFKKETGKSVIEYLNTIRIEKAKDLLENTNLKNYEIGERVGIVNPSYFSTLFKKEAGCTIQEYRYKNKNSE